MKPRRLALLLAIGLTPAAGAAPLKLTERFMPGLPPSPDLSVLHEDADRVEVRHSGDNWSQSHAMRLAAGEDSIWSIAAAELGWVSGHYEFKLLVNGNWEAGPNRYAFINTNNLIARPPAVYLTWQRDPATTITIHWLGDEPGEPSRVEIAAAGEHSWRAVEGAVIPMPETDRWIHTVEVMDLDPDTLYAFRLGAGSTYTFRTLPDTMTRPIRFIEGGDVFGIADAMDRMNALVGSRDPDFVVIGGDLAYEDGLAEYAWRWHRMFASFHEHMRAPDGRLIPMVVAIGNHEVQGYYVHRREDYQPGPEWQLAAAPYFYRLFAMPGRPGYNVLDLGDYASFILLDSGHTAPVAGEQTDWLRERLAERSNRPHLFPVYHVPAYPGHRNPDDALNTEVRRHWVPLFEAAGVRLAFEHHDHCFKVTHPLRDGKVHADGIVFIGDGAWGVGLRPPHTPENQWYIRRSAMTRHVIEVELTPTNRTIQALTIDGQVLDVFGQIIPAITVDENR